MKKIVLVGPVLRNLTNFRGELIDRLVAEGYGVTLVCADADLNNSLMPKGAEGVKVDVDRRGTKALKDLKQICTYLRVLKQLKPNVALLYTTKCAIYAGIACRWLKIPYVVNNSGLIDISTLSKPVEVVLRLLYRMGYNKSECLMCQNSYERDYFKRVLGRNHCFIDIPGSGVNLNKYALQPYPGSNSPIVFNYVARIAKFKGIEEYLECARRIHTRYPDTLFRIYGSYDESGYKEAIDKLSAEGIVEYMGCMADMRPEVTTCHAVIHPSHYEGLTNVILEHGAMGRVSIASDIPGCREAIEDGKTGFLFPVKNIDALVEVVERFIQMPLEKKASMGAMARRKIEKEFDRQIVTNIYLREIERIFKKSEKI